jgi:hypothetical protein
MIPPEKCQNLTKNLARGLVPIDRVLMERNLQLHLEHVAVAGNDRVERGSDEEAEDQS